MTRALALLALAGCGSHSRSQVDALAHAPTAAGPGRVLLIEGMGGRALWPLACVGGTGQVAGGDDCLAPIRNDAAVRLVADGSIVKGTGKDSIAYCQIAGETPDTTAMLLVPGVPELALAVWPRDADLAVKPAATLAAAPAPGIGPALAAAVKAKGPTQIVSTLADDVDGDGREDRIYVVTAAAEPDNDQPMTTGGVFVVTAAHPEQVVPIHVSTMPGERLRVVATADVAGNHHRQIIGHETWDGGFELWIAPAERGAKVIHSYGCSDR